MKNAPLAFLLLGSFLVLPATNAQDPPKADPNAAGAAGNADKEKKAQDLVHERFAARVTELVKAADSDTSCDLGETEFGPLPKQARDARAEIVKAVYAELGIPAPEKKKANGGQPPAGAAGKKKKKGGGGGGGGGANKKQGQHKTAADKAAEEFKKADADGNGKVTLDEAKAFLVSIGG